jgi:hypothetical protein
VWAVDTSGVLWQQNGIFGSWGHWLNDNHPSGTKLVSGPSAVVGSDQSRQVFATAANGHVYDFNGTQFQDRGLPPGTTAVGTPATGVNGTLARVVVRGANGHIELLSQTNATTWQWTDLGSAGGTTTYNPGLTVFGGYMALAVTLPNGHLSLKEFFGGGPGAAWRDLGAFSSPSASAPTMLFLNNTVSAYVTGANGQVEVATFPLFGAATLSGLPSLIFNTLPTAAGAPSVSMLNGQPTIFVTDTAGNTWQMTYTTIGFGRFHISGYGATNFGSLLGSTMRPPTVLSAYGNVSAFAVGSNQHVGQTNNFGSRTGLIDHSALSRVVYEAHAQRQLIIGTQSQARRTAAILPISEWGPVVNEGQMDASTGITATYADAFRFQATQFGSVVCQAYVDTVGWTAEVSDGQPCGSIDQAHGIDAIRLRLADAPAGMHILYRCLLAGTWSPWTEDGAGCGATNFNQTIMGVQVQYSDTAAPEISYRTDAGDTWQPWGSDGAAVGAAGQPMESIEVHSNVGGNLRCAAYTSSDGWHLGVDDDSACGNTGSSQTMKAFRLFLAGGPAGEHVEYRALITGQGWSGWQSDGNVVGTPSGSAPNIEQIEVQAFH